MKTLHECFFEFTARLYRHLFCILYPFFTNCKAMELAEIGQIRRDFLDLLLQLLIMCHAIRQECLKLMKLIASDQRS